MAFQKTGIEPIDDVLRQMEQADGRDEFEELTGVLATVTRNYIDEIIERFDTFGHTNYYLVMSLRYQTTKQAMPLFEKAIKDKDQFVREAAAEALTKYRNRKASKLLVEALKDRSSMVKFIAVTAMSKFRDPDAIPQLKKIIQSKHIQKTSPGVIDRAKKALKRCGGQL